MKNNPNQIRISRKGGMRGRVSSGEKPKNLPAALKKIFNYGKKYQRTVIFCTLLSIIGSIISIFAPNQISNLTDVISAGLTTKINFYEVKKIVIILFLIYLIASGTTLIVGLTMTTVSNKFSKNLRDDISSKINKLPLKYFDNHSYGDILSRITNDVDAINQVLQNNIVSLINAIALVLGSIIMMVYTNLILAITTILSTIIGFILIVFILGKSQRYFIERQNALGDLNGHIEEMYSNHTIVKVYNGKQSSNKKFDFYNEKEYKANLKSQFLSGIMQPIMIFSGDFSYVAVCIVGAVLASQNIITFGVIMAFILYVRIFSGPLRQIAMSLGQLQSAGAASERVFEFLEEEELFISKNKKRTLKAKDVKGNIEFKNVNFGYNSKKLVIQDFSVKVKAGQKVAIVGPTGAGKTTLVNLLMRFYDIEEGDILIDGISIRDLTRENVRDLFIMVLQDTWLFEGTIRENIVYNNKNISDAKIKDICTKIGLDHFIKTQSNGLDHQIIDSESISAGQKQLITIARGMIANAPFLILDEATSNVDTRTEVLVQQAMDKLMKGRTTFVIAHRLSTIKNANLILVMKDGNIVEKGTHANLLKINGHYAELYNSQFSKID
ncbi:MAG: ABC transporter ATP-binding protein [Bacilli bacterium]|nr:ABC transporter ATP-binding protein [Bacilli bacterium]